MSEIYVSLLLHFYQPPWQREDVLKRIIDECYLPLIDYLKRNKSLPLTINLNYSLIEVLKNHRFNDIAEGFEQVMPYLDVTNTAAYHIIIPLVLALPNGEIIVRDQIELNKRYLERIGAKPTGFFPPEMAVDEETIRVAESDWVMADAISYDFVNRGTIPFDYIGIFVRPIFFRSSHWSNELTLGMPSRRDFNIESYIKRLLKGINEWFNGNSGYIILAFDGETLGHHVPQYRNFLEQFFNELERLKIKIVPVSRLLEIFPQRKIEVISKASWSTSLDDIRVGKYYPLWLDTENEIHIRWYEILRQLAEVYPFLDEEQKKRVQREMNSCIPWHSSHGNNSFFDEWIKGIEKLNQEIFHNLVKV
ncbi:MAG: hypothetical protein QXJ06_04290 [Candidatus Aenigmatarchaeota archaeon]